MVEVETGALREWNLLQIEGEEPVKEEIIDPKASPAKKSPTKPGSKQVIEEVLDDRLRTIFYKKDFAAENGDTGVKFTEQIAAKFQSTVMKISVIESDKVVE